MAAPKTKTAPAAKGKVKIRKKEKKNVAVGKRSSRALSTTQLFLLPIQPAL